MHYMYSSLHTKYVVFTYNSHTYHGPLSLCNGGRGYLVSRAPHIITSSKRHCNCRQRKHLFIPCLAQKSRSLISHIHLLFYIKNKLFYIFLQENKVSDFSYTPVAQFAHQNVWDLPGFIYTCGFTEFTLFLQGL